MLRRLISASVLCGLTLGLVCLTCLAGCGDGSFHVDRAAGFPRSPAATISVLGVYRDGRLAPEAWDVFRPHLTPLFGVPACEPGFPDILASSGQQVVAAVDDYSRANGVTDELMDKLAPLAKGEFILLLVVNGRPGKHSDSDSTPTPTAPTPSGRGGGRRGTPSSGSSKTTTEVPQFEAVGILFSTKAHRSVGAIRMNYAGASIDEALEMFTSKLGSELPQATCSGWTGGVHLDASDIRRLATE
jgi:hypothetical protein